MARWGAAAVLREETAGLATPRDDELVTCAGGSGVGGRVLREQSVKDQHVTFSKWLDFTAC